MAEAQAARNGAHDSRLKHVLGWHHFLGLGFGAIIGVAWVVMLGEWLARATPAGAIAGFVVGGFLIAVVGKCYAEMAAQFPATGGEVIYALRLFGPAAAFGVGWFLVLFWIAVTAYEGVSVYWILEQLDWGILPTPVYSVLGHDISSGAILVGLAGMTALAALNYRGAASAARFQNVANVVFLTGAASFLVAGFASGSTERLSPSQLTAGSTDWHLGALWIVATCPFWLSGFQIIPQLIEERTEQTRPSVVGKTIVGAISLAVLFYVLVIVASVLVAPVQSLTSADLALAEAMRVAFSNEVLAKIVLFTALVGLLTTWNASFMVASRLLFSLSREGLMPPRLSTIHDRFGSPHLAVLFVAVIGSLGVLLGRGAIVPIANMSSICLAFAFSLTCLCLIRQRARTRPASARKRASAMALPSIGLLGSIFMASYAFAAPFLTDGTTFPLEWILLGGWAALGVAARYTFRGLRKGEAPAIKPAEARVSAGEWSNSRCFRKPEQ